MKNRKTNVTCITKATWREKKRNWPDYRLTFTNRYFLIQRRWKEILSDGVFDKLAGSTLNLGVSGISVLPEQLSIITSSKIAAGIQVQRRILADLRICKEEVGSVHNLEGI